MHWEDKDKVPPSSEIADSELPIELLTPLGEISAKGKIRYVRLRVWPVGAISYVKKNNLMVDPRPEGVDVGEYARTIARELVAGAKHFWMGETEIEPKFEAQIVFERDGDTKLTERSASFRLRTTATEAASPKDGSPVTKIIEFAKVAESNPQLGFLLLMTYMHEQQTKLVTSVLVQAEDRCRRAEGRIDTLHALTFGGMDTLLSHSGTIANIGFQAWQGSIEAEHGRAEIDLEKAKAEAKAKGFDKAVEGFTTVAKEVIKTAFTREVQPPTTPPRQPPKTSPPTSPPKSPSSPRPTVINMSTNDEPKPEPKPHEQQLAELGRHLRLSITDEDFAAIERQSKIAADKIRALDPDAIQAKDVHEAVTAVLENLNMLQLARLREELSDKTAEAIHDVMTVLR